MTILHMHILSTYIWYKQYTTHKMSLEHDSLTEIAVKSNHTCLCDTMTVLDAGKSKKKIIKLCQVIRNNVVVNHFDCSVCRHKGRTFGIKPCK